MNEKPKADWEAAKAAFLAKIDEIDKATEADPAYPMREPDWWVEMMDCRRFVAGNRD